MHETFKNLLYVPSQLYYKSAPPFWVLFSCLSSSDYSCKQRGNNSDNHLSKVANKTMEGCRLRHKMGYCDRCR